MPKGEGKDEITEEFKAMVLKCSENRELLKEFDRLRKTNMSTIGKGGINGMIDDTTGRTKDSMEKFTQFVYEVIWCPLIYGFVPEHYEKKKESR